MAHSYIFREFAEIAENYSAKPAIFFQKNKQYTSLSYNQIHDFSLKLGNLLSAKGVKRLDKVAMLMGNQLEWPISFLAIQSQGAVAVPLDVNLTPTDIHERILHSRSRILLCSAKIKPNPNVYLKDLNNFEIIFVDSAEFLDKLESSLRQMPGDNSLLTEDDLAAMFYTSGTTDFPKAILLSQKNLLSNFQSIKKIKIAHPEDVFISLLPLHHTYSFMVTCLLPLLLGAQISYPQGMNSEDILSCMRDTQVTLLTGVPQLFLHFHRAIKEKFKQMPLIIRLFLGVIIDIFWIIRKYTRININKLLLSKLHRTFGNKLRFMITGGARIEPKITTDLFKWGFTVLEGYGLTETSPVATFNRPARVRIGSVGQAVPDVQVKIINPDEHGVGEVAIKGPNVMLGYYQMPEENQRVIKEGWFFSGDLGYLDRNGYLFVGGRKDELIVLSSGKKVNPEEIEKHYSQSPFIKEMCALASKENDKIEGSTKLMAVIVPNEEYFRLCEQVNIEEKIKWELDNFSQKITTYRRINGFIISKDKLPRTALGKLMRHKVAELYLNKLATTKRQAGQISEEDLSLGSSEVAKVVVKYLSDRLHKSINLGDHLELDLGIDSLGRIELLLELEKLLGLEVSESLAEELFYANTIKDLILKVKDFLPDKFKLSAEKKFNWSEIISQPPAQDTVKNIRLTPYFLDKVFTCIFFTAFQFFFRAFFLLEVRGKSNFPAKGPFLMYPNHTSYLDGFIIATSIPFRLASSTYFVGFKKYFLHPVFKNLVKTARLVPIDITLELVEAMQAYAYLLKNSKIICFFPEGQRHIGEDVGPFKKGIGIIAKEVNIPLVPVYIEGAFRSWPRFALLPHPSKIRVTIGKPIMPSELLSQTIGESDVYESMAELLRDRLISLKDL